MNTPSQQRIPFRGKSMSPLVVDGDEIIVDLFQEPQKIDESLVGKICFYNDGKEWITHRVIESEGQLYIKGDNAKSYERVEVTKVWGLVSGIKTSKGRYIKFKDDDQLSDISQTLSSRYMQNQGIKARVYKGALYALNMLRRIFGK